ncbi:hypothetical protein [Altericroceibacterium xinjiangense]|uniref:hypothetical protein n=1 Tax=Altericroceibacterium xinjiangense TaxID=762261 RepID=UPI000F7E15B9|nr:hypothetical protein [Altericroceibacterium xinjiangense]
MRAAFLMVPAFSLMLGGCLAKTAIDLATAPVRMVGKAADLATTSQSEADENRGRELRRREERLGQLQRDYEKQSRKCVDGDRRACAQMQMDYQEIQQLLPTVPVEPQRR